jgi:transglutaminase superfamily protein
MDEATRAFYATPAPMTALPFATHEKYLADLPADAAAAAQVVRGVLVHRDWAPVLGLSFGPDRLADQHLRSMRDVVARVVALRDAPLAVERPLGDRMVGVCRHFAALHVALLRDAGVPARARVGFARYFEDGWVDHWVTEWWDGNRWVMTDAQIGPVAADALRLTFDPADMPPGEFLTAGEAWLRCRAGDEDPQRFGIFDIRGLFFVAGNVTNDLAALNKVELLPWDVWGSLGGGPGWAPTDEEAAPVDAVARLLVEGDLPAVRERFAEPDVAVPPTIISIVDGRPTPVPIDPALVSA